MGAVSAEAGRKGRPTRAEAAALGARVLDAATRLFLREGYEAVSMEAIASAACVSKRTLYARFTDKAAVMQAVLGRLIDAWTPAIGLDAEPGEALEPVLLRAAQHALEAALKPEALALHRLFIAEAARFPELGELLAHSPARAGLRRLAQRLREAGVREPNWAAEQFFHLILTGPQRRALGLAPRLDAADITAWAQRSVALFLRGVGAA